MLELKIQNVKRLSTSHTISKYYSLTSEEWGALKLKLKDVVRVEISKLY